MYQIDNATSVAVMPTVDVVGPNPNSYFYKGDPTTNTPATIVEQDWLNTIQQELINILVAGGVTADKTKQDQVVKAINYLSQKSAAIYAASTTAANTYTATLAPVPAAYSTGMVCIIQFTNHNTGIATINLNGLGAKTITKCDGSALALKDIADNMIAVLYYDGTNFQLINPNPANYVTQTQFQNDAPTFAVCSSAANTFAINLNPAPTAYTQGMRLSVLFNNANTGAATLNVNGLGAKTIVTFNGAALIAANIRAGMIANLVYDGTNFQLLNPASSVRFNLVTVTSNQTYIPSTNIIYADVEAIGGGGGGGGAAAGTAAAAGGAAGGYCKKRFTAAQLGASVVCTIGAGGTGAVAGNNNGGNGGNTSFGALLTANGGSGGAGCPVAANPTVGGAGTSGGSATGGDVNTTGAFGGNGLILGTSGGAQVISGNGGSTIYGGGGGGGEAPTNGNAGTGFGSGGGGGASSGSIQSGANGAPGVIIINEVIAA